MEVNVNKQGVWTTPTLYEHGADSEHTTSNEDGVVALVHNDYLEAQEIYEL